jgi:hypothetical protein
MSAGIPIVEIMDESTVSDLLSTLVRQGEEQTELLKSIDARLVDVIQGVATVADVSMG